MNKKEWSGLTDTVDSVDEKELQDLVDEQEMEVLKWPGDLESLDGDDKRSSEKRGDISDLYNVIYEAPLNPMNPQDVPYIGTGNGEGMQELKLRQYMDHEAWSTVLADQFGCTAAISFADSSDALLDTLNECLDDLSSKPKGVHAGQLDFNGIAQSLPPQFAMSYDYDFIYYLRSVLIQYRFRAKQGMEMQAHTVAEELVLYLCAQEIDTFIDMNQGMSEEEREELGKPDYATEWIFDLLGDMDIETYLYSDLYLDKKHPYHFSHWDEPQFYLNNRLRKESPKK